MDVDKISVFTAVGFALAVGAFVLWGPSPKPRRKGQVEGIKNLGYTCFLNSLLQSLAACPAFIEWLRGRQSRVKPESFTNTLMSVVDKVNGFTDDLFGSVRPVEVITSLGPLWNFAPGHQDAHELFHVFLSALQAELQTAGRKGGLSDALPKTPLVITDIKGSGDPVNLRSVSCNDIASVNNGTCEIPNETNKILNNHVMNYAQSITNVSVSMTSIKPGIIIARSSEIISKIIEDKSINEKSTRPWTSLYAIPSQPNSHSLSSPNKVHPFSGLLTSQLICTECEWKSPVHFEKLESVSLPLPPTNDDFTWKRLTLVGLLSRLVSREVVSDVQCDGCNNRCPAYRTLTFGKLPKCLCLHIPRTTWSPSGITIKRDDPVVFYESLILDPFTYTETKRKSTQGNLQAMTLLNPSIHQGKHKYYLYAVIEHRGPVDAGHFVCYRRGNRPGQWLYTSDTIVEKITLEEVLNASPYLLFYERAVTQNRH
ncbi:ubiquitin carboxyl-terminal hydrolase 30 [Phymastichus coffea]|uniref:ubiquitin carboxyl-terminal hydrolase 30 n=1 Tax=Phymastichus coffea TaxID=108790 RepID=UPI00273BF8B5|nr:ubiquitin carboxyl-terminal hydrolase 30 [Phymastichus coffea]XP_058802776.1 ubiquitin carboxyl-terminal hydrolase 30 [Phymastichus coffea]